MLSLVEISLQRSNLPFFPGGTYPEKLINARNAARAALAKYVSEEVLNYSTTEANKTVARVDLWIDKNGATLEQIIADTSSQTLPEAIQLELGNKAAAAYVLHGFTEAARGLGPWMSGKIAQEAAKGKVLNDRWAREDADMRVATFGLIVRMDEDGTLAEIFLPPTATSGFGAVPAIAVWAIAIVVVAIAAMIISYFYLSKQLTINNRLMEDLCKEAQRTGDEATVQECVRLTADLQKPPGIVSALMWTAIVLGLGYIAITQAPSLVASRSRSSSSSSKLSLMPAK